MSPFDNTDAIKHLTETWRYQVSYVLHKNWAFLWLSASESCKDCHGGPHLTLQAVPAAGELGRIWCSARGRRAGFGIGPSAVGEEHKARPGISMCIEANSVLPVVRVQLKVRSCLCSVSPGNPFVSQWVLWHLCCLPLSMPNHGFRL